MEEMPGCFYDHGFDLTGIEISKSAVDLACHSGLQCEIHHGSVVDMPFDDKRYGGIFCYALIHLLTKKERRAFLQSCFNQLKSGGIMLFTVISKETSMYGTGRMLSKDRFEIFRGLNVFFYDDVSLQREFRDFGMTAYQDIDEPIKYMTGEDPLKCKFVICRKD